MSRINVARAFVLFALIVLLVVALCKPATASAENRACDGPSQCCPTDQTTDLSTHVDVAIGVTLVGIANVNEKAGTWDADFYLKESWEPTPHFTPQTEIVNEISRVSERFDTTELRSGKCIRTRHIHSTLRNAYNLRLFPFDFQELAIQFSDAEFPSSHLSYASRPSVAALDDGARSDLSSWKTQGELRYANEQRVFSGDDGAPTYDYATFSVSIRRHITYHLTKFFLPLLVIVIIAFGAFWVDPEDLSSRVSIGVTCLLSAIAFQLADATSLPEVTYLTLADRVYAACYLALAIAMVESIVVGTYARRGLKQRAQKVDRWARRLLPALVFLALGASTTRALTMGG